MELNTCNKLAGAAVEDQDHVQDEGQGRAPDEGQGRVPDADHAAQDGADLEADQDQGQYLTMSSWDVHRESPSSPNYIKLDMAFIELNGLPT